MSNGNVARLLVLDQDATEIRNSQTAIASLLDKEAVAKKMFEDLPATADQDERFNKAAQLFHDCGDMVDLAKELQEILGRVKKRMEGVQQLVYEGLHEEVKAVAEVGDKVEVPDWILKRKLNPVKVVIDDEKAVAKKYRLEPKPIPEWTEWKPDKNAIKQALTKEKVQSVAGAHIEQGEKLEIKPR